MVSPVLNDNLVEEPLRILLVEDNPGDVVIIRELLRNQSGEVSLFVAKSLKEAMDHLSNSHFDVILLDLGLPDSFGINTLREFLVAEYSPPVVVMTGLDDEETALAALRQGAQDYLVKNSLETENIIRSVKYSIERKKLENLQKKNSRQLTILSESTSALFYGEDHSEVYRTVCNSIRKLTGNTCSIAIQHENEDLFRLSNIEQIGQWKDEVKNYTGYDLDELALSTSMPYTDLRELFMDGQMHLVENGIYEIGARTIPEEACKLLQKISGFRYTYILGLLWNEKSYGGVITFSPSEIPDDDIKLIENICSQASMSIHRRLIQKNLVLSEGRYQKLAGELEQKVMERTAELEKVNAQLRLSETQLRELNATKDKFFNIVAHDLKNPFTSLLGATELLYNNIQNMDREKIRKLAQILNDSAKSGYAILLNLLDWSRSQTGTIKINLQMLNISRIIQENIADIQLVSLDKHITVTCDVQEEIVALADKNMLNTILRNLLSNAIKFTPRGGTIVISGEVKNQDIIISVRDNGIGIARENIDKLFRLDSKYTRPGTDKETGTGLGLKLSREFIEKLGGRIWVDSTENKGSTFTFSIPLQDS